MDYTQELLKENFSLLKLKLKPTTFQISSLVQSAAHFVMWSCPLHCRCDSTWHPVNPWHSDDGRTPEVFKVKLQKTSFALYYLKPNQTKQNHHQHQETKQNPNPKNKPTTQQLCHTLQNNLDLLI